jgi:hypothetical protein
LAIFQYQQRRFVVFHHIDLQEVCLRVIRLASSVLLFVLSAYTVSFAFNPADSVRQSLKAVRIHGDVELTGTLSDPRWNQAPIAEIGYEIMPGENVPAPVRTTVRILYNSDYVYFGFRCEDSYPPSIRAHITDRDKISDDDRVGIILDTYGDFQRSYEFIVNPHGIQADYLRTGNNEDGGRSPIQELTFSFAAGANMDCAPFQGLSTRKPIPDFLEPNKPEQPLPGMSGWRH